MSKPQQQPAKKPTLKSKPFPYMVYIQFDGSKKAYSFGAFDEYKTNEPVVVETVRGQEIGTVYVPSMPYDESKIKGDIKPILRRATEKDLKRKAENEERPKKLWKSARPPLPNWLWICT